MADTYDGKVAELQRARQAGGQPAGCTGIVAGSRAARRAYGSGRRACPRHPVSEGASSSPLHGQDIAVIMVGVNDALKFTSRRAWRANIEQLIDELAKHLRPGGQVVLAGLPDLGGFEPFRNHFALTAPPTCCQSCSNLAKPLCA
jgi:lysophospholipase L1-like esterase